MLQVQHCFIFLSLLLLSDYISLHIRPYNGISFADFHTDAQFSGCCFPPAALSAISGTIPPTDCLCLLCLPLLVVRHTTMSSLPYTAPSKFILEIISLDDVRFFSPIYINSIPFSKQMSSSSMCFPL